MAVLTIGQLARKAGVGVETVRFYERRGLLEEPDRKQSGYRQYGEDEVARLRFIRRAKELGFSLKEIAELMGLRHDPSATRSDVRERVRSKVEDIEAKLRDLLRIKEVLLSLSDACHGDGPAEDCPILRAIDEPSRDEPPEGEADSEAHRQATSRRVRRGTR